MSDTGLTQEGLEALNRRLSQADRITDLEAKLAEASLHDKGQEARLASLRQSLNEMLNENRGLALGGVEIAAKNRMLTEEISRLETLITEAERIIERYASDCCNIEPCSVCVASASWLHDAVRAVREAQG